LKLLQQKLSLESQSDLEEKRCTADSVELETDLRPRDTAVRVYVLTSGNDVEGSR
ncbi:uncharacterized, partial [Tachysurus ichikawai]